MTLTALSCESIIPKSANTSAEARLDISAGGVWTTGQWGFFDVRVFNPFARSYSGLTHSQAYRANENEKKRFTITLTNRLIANRRGGDVY